MYILYTYICVCVYVLYVPRGEYDIILLNEDDTRRRRWPHAPPPPLRGNEKLIAAEVMCARATRLRLTPLLCVLLCRRSTHAKL